MAGVESNPEYHRNDLMRQLKEHDEFFIREFFHLNSN